MNFIELHGPSGNPLYVRIDAITAIIPPLDPKGNNTVWVWGNPLYVKESVHEIVRLTKGA